MRGLRYLAMPPLLLATVAQAQIGARDATPPRVAATTVAATDGSGLALSAPVVAVLGSNGAPLSTASGPQPSASSTSVTPATDAYFPIAGLLSGSTTKQPILSDPYGNLRVFQTLINATGSDAFSNGAIGMAQASFIGGSQLPLLTGQAGYVFNGASWDRRRGDVNGSYVGGNVASGVADAGYPVKIGGVYNAAMPTLTAGQRGDLQLDARGNVRVTLIGADGVSAIGGARVLNSDGQGASVNTLSVAANGFVFNGTTWDRQRGDTNGAYIVSKGGAGLATAQVSTSTTATLIAPARTGRQKITLGVGAANTCAFGAAGVTLTTGYPLQPVAGASITLDTSAAIYAVCSATTTISALELF